MSVYQGVRVMRAEDMEGKRVVKAILNDTTIAQRYDDGSFFYGVATEYEELNVEGEFEFNEAVELGIAGVEQVTAQRFLKLERENERLRAELAEARTHVDRSIQETEKSQEAALGKRVADEELGRLMAKGIPGEDLPV